MEYEFTFVVDGVDVEDDALVCALFDSLDAMLVRTAGRHFVTLSAEGPGAIRAAQTAVAALATVAPAMRVIRLDRDLVGIADIAERTKRTRQNVTQWAHGARHSKQPFPLPDGVVGCSRVWLWSEVNTWLRTIDLGDPIELPSREEMAAIDYALAFPRQDLGLTLELHIAADEHERERHEVARRLMAKAVAHAGRISDDDVYGGGPILVVCAVCSDSLAWVMSQLPLGGKLAVVAVSVGDDGDVWELGLSAVPLPGSVPLEQAGLDCHASVGDLVRAHSSGRLDRQTVLEM